MRRRWRPGTTGPSAYRAGMSSSHAPGARTAPGSAGRRITCCSTTGRQSWRSGGPGRCSAAGASTCRRGPSQQGRRRERLPTASPRWPAGRVPPVTTRSWRTPRSRRRQATPRSWSRGFHPVEEVGPSRHRVGVSIPPGAGDDVLLAGIAKTTRQRFLAAERRGMRIVRHDIGAGDLPVPGLESPVPDPAGPPALAAFERFYALLGATGATWVHDRPARCRDRLVARGAGGRPPGAPGGALGGRCLPGGGDLLPQRRAAEPTRTPATWSLSGTPSPVPCTCSSGARCSWRSARSERAGPGGCRRGRARCEPRRVTPCSACSSSSGRSRPLDRARRRARAGPASRPGTGRRGR